jgi:WD40 repeat protein
MIAFKNPEEPFLLKRLDNISYKPILSVGNFISLDIECVVGGSSDRKLRFLDVDYLSEIASATMDKKNVSFVAISEMSPEGDDPVIVTGGKDSIIQVWNPTVDSIDRTSITLPTTEVRSLDVYQGSRCLAVIGTKDGKVFVWDLKENVEVVRFSGHTASVHCVLIANTATGMGNDSDDPEEDLKHLCIATGGADRVVRTWDLQTGKRNKKFRHQRSISSMVVTKREERPVLATAGVERQIKLWDLDSGILLRTLTGHLDQINCLSLWEGCQMLLISGSSDRTIRVYDMLSGECIVLLHGHRDAVLSLTLTDFEFPKIVSSSEDLSLIQWDLHEMISTFYYTSGELLLGNRNKVPAHLPTQEYSAPEELDRSKLSKDERKRIRKERKKQQRIKNLLNDWKAPSSSKLGEGESTRSTATGASSKNKSEKSAGKSEKKKKKKSKKSQDEDDDDDDDEDEDDELIPGFEDMPDDFDENDDDLMEELEEGIINFFQSNKNGAPAATKEEGSVSFSEPVDEKKESIEAAAPALSAPSLSARLGRASQLFVGKILTNAISRVTPEEGEAGDEQKEGATPSEPVFALSRQNSSSSSRIVTETATTSLIKSLSKALLGLGSVSTVAVEIPAEVEKDTPPTSSSTINSGESKEGLQPIETAEKNNVNNNNNSQSKKQSSMIQAADAKETNFRVLASAATTKYNIATVEHQLASDRSKKKAAVNLQARLNSRKSNSGNTAPATKTIEGEEKTEENELHELKAEKLRQHKLQESRRRESMAVAKARSANALAKRLEELAAKKKTADGNQGNQITAINEGDEDDSDDSRDK